MQRAIAGSVLALLILARPLAAGSGAVCTPSQESVALPPEVLEATPCVGGMAGPYPCSNVDLMALVPLTSMGCDSGNSIYGWTDPLDGKEYALMGCDNGISFIDVSTPDAPVYLGRLPTHEPEEHVGQAPDHEGDSLWRDVRVYANHAFVVSEQPHHHMQVFDLTQLRSVTSPPVVFAESALYDGLDNQGVALETVHTIAINTNTGFAYLAGSNTCNGGLHMVNIQDPMNPVFAGCVANDGYVHETQCATYNGPDADYAGHEICFNANVDTLTIVDVTNKSNPDQLSRSGYAGSGYTHQGWLTEDQRYFLLNDELDEVDFGHNSYTYIWDLADLDAPVLMGHYTGPTTAIDHNLYVRGGYVYESNYRAGLRILDITGVANAQLFQAAFIDTYPADNAPEFNSNWNNYPYFESGNVILSDIEQGLFIVHPNLNPFPTSIAIGDVTVTEDDAGTVTASFPISLSHSVPQTVTVGYTTGLGSAIPGVDYTAASGTFTFDPNVTSGTIDVTILGDLLDEADETFSVSLSNPTNASIADNTGQGKILDNDPVPTVSIGDASVAEGNSGPSVATFTVSLSAPSGRSVSVPYATSAGTAQAGFDYTEETGSVAFAAGVTTRPVTVNVTGDLAEEDDETFLVTLGAPANAAILDGEATGTILDDDAFHVGGVSPSSGAASGLPVTILGAGFASGAGVTVGGLEALDVTVVGPGEISATTPALAPGTVNDVTVTNPPATPTTLPSAFFADFLDVDALHPFHDFVVTVARNGVTAGCGTGNYCPGASVTRAQMAVFLLKAKNGANYTPPACSGTVFTDVPCTGGAFDPWIEDLAGQGVTGGCGAGVYCPDNPVTRAQMAIFLLKTLEGSTHVPPAATGIFGDVAVGDFAADWIEDLYTRGVTGGCSTSPLLYCPNNPNTRGQMAVFLTRTFSLQ